MMAEIAGKIGDTLRQSGLQVDVLPVNNVKNLAPNKAVVLGSAVYRAITVFLKLIDEYYYCRYSKN